MTKRQRHEAILDLVGSQRITSQENLRELLARRGFDTTQATLSRDIRELRLIKLADAEGRAHYARPPDTREQVPPLERVLPALFVSVDGTGNLLVVRTLAGGAQPVASALDWEEWPEVVGTVAGDDSILIVLRDPEHYDQIRARIVRLAGAEPESSGA